MGFAIWHLKYFNQTFVHGSTAVILLNLYAKFPPPSPSQKLLGVILDRLTQV